MLPLIPRQLPLLHHGFRHFLLPLALFGLIPNQGFTADVPTDRSDSTEIPLIPRKVLFGNPDRAAARFSPDGTKISFLAPVDGVLNVWVGPSDAPGAAKPVTQDKGRGIQRYFWSYTGQHLIYLQDQAGEENDHVYLVDVETRETRDLTPIQGVRAEIVGVSHRTPGEILVGLNDRNPELHDLYRVNLLSGERTLIEENPGFSSYLTDEDLKVRFAMRMTPDGGNECLKRDTEGEWKSYFTIGMEDSLTTSPVGFTKDGKSAYLLDSRGRDTAALVLMNLEDDSLKVIAEDPKSDIQTLLAHPTENTPIAVASQYEKTVWKILDLTYEEDFNKLKQLSDGEFSVVSQTLDNQIWMVAFLLDNGPVRYYKYDRTTRKGQFLFTNRKDLEGLKLARMYPQVIKSRDGLNLVSYLSLPLSSDMDGNGKPEKPLPTVLLVHGGPWGRSEWGYDPNHQWLTNRGYAVLDVNFRGSTGFGKHFINAGNKEWAGKMHEDLIDAVQWAIHEGIADASKVAIMGGSYGGYATLVGLTFTPDLFACGIDIVGPSNLITLLETIPPYWAPMMALFTSRVGDLSTEEGKAFLKSRSPLTYADRIKKPLLIGQGANDPRVKQSEADQIVQALKQKKIPVTYVLFPDEGHGFVRPENDIAFTAVAEAFLSEQLGGRFEEIGKDFEGSSITVPEGKNEVPGLETALQGKKGG